MKYIDINSKAFESKTKTELLTILKRMGLLTIYPTLKNESKEYLIKTIRANW